MVVSISSSDFFFFENLISSFPSFNSTFTTFITSPIKYSSNHLVIFLRSISQLFIYFIHIHNHYYYYLSSFIIIIYYYYHYFNCYHIYLLLLLSIIISIIIIIFIIYQNHFFITFTLSLLWLL